jgi:phosphatidylglycerophosphate synthase
MNEFTRKLPRSLECPIDNGILDLVDFVNPYFYTLGFTPNGLTFVSAVFGIACAVHCYYHLYVYASIFHFIGYFFDCADGNFARRYNMVSKFGDLFDHIKDVLVGGLCVGVMMYNNNVLYYYYILFGILLFFNNLYLGEQENYFQGQKSDFLKVFTIRKCRFSLKFLRFFGCGAINTYISCILLLLHFKLI